MKLTWVLKAAKIRALANLNFSRAAAGKPPLKRCPKIWWDHYGMEYIQLETAPSEQPAVRVGLEALFFPTWTAADACLAANGGGRIEWDQYMGLWRIDWEGGR